MKRIRHVVGVFCFRYILDTYRRQKKIVFTSSVVSDEVNYGGTEETTSSTEFTLLIRTITDY